jgi:hypothetical protein
MDCTAYPEIIQGLVGKKVFFCYGSIQLTGTVEEGLFGIDDKGRLFTDNDRITPMTKCYHFFTLYGNTMMSYDLSASCIDYVSPNSIQVKEGVRLGRLTNFQPDSWGNRKQLQELEAALK